jgi:hypothetical protein
MDSDHSTDAVVNQHSGTVSGDYNSIVNSLGRADRVL